MSSLPVETNGYIISSLRATSIIPKNVRIVGYTDKMMLYMDAADFFMTKSGIEHNGSNSKRNSAFCIDAVPAVKPAIMSFLLSNYVLYGKTKMSLSTSL